MRERERVRKKKEYTYTHTLPCRCFCVCQKEKRRHGGCSTHYRYLYLQRVTKCLARHALARCIEKRERNTRTHKRQKLSLRKMKPDVESHHLHGTVSPPFSTKEQGRETKTKTEIKKGHTTSRAVTIFPFSLFFFFLCFLCSSSTT